MRLLVTSIVLGALLAASGCSTLSGARPLEPGQHQFGMTLGGPMVLLGEAPIPLPNANLEGRHGLAVLADRPIDINYGVNATAFAFGMLQVHVGSSYLLLHQDGGIPAISVTDRIFFAINPFDLSSKADGAFGAWGMNQVEFSFSWLLGGQLVYVALAHYLDFLEPGLLFTPALGAAFDPGDEGGLRLNLELRWYALSFTKDLDTVRWFPGGQGPGSLGVSLGFSYQL